MVGVWSDNLSCVPFVGCTDEICLTNQNSHPLIKINSLIAIRIFGERTDAIRNSYFD